MQRADCRSTHTHRVVAPIVLQPVVREAHVPAHDSLVVARGKVAHVGNVIKIHLRLCLVAGAAQPVGFRIGAGEAQGGHHLRAAIHRQSGRIRIHHRNITSQCAECASHCQIAGRATQFILRIAMRIHLRLSESGAPAKGEHRHRQNYIFHLKKCCFLILPKNDYLRPEPERPPPPIEPPPLERPPLKPPEAGEPNELPLEVEELRKEPWSEP